MQLTIISLKKTRAVPRMQVKGRKKRVKNEESDKLIISGHCDETERTKSIQKEETGKTVKKLGQVEFNVIHPFALCKKRKTNKYPHILSHP